MKVGQTRFYPSKDHNDFCLNQRVGPEGWVWCFVKRKQHRGRTSPAETGRDSGGCLEVLTTPTVSAVNSVFAPPCLDEDLHICMWNAEVRKYCNLKPHDDMTTLNRSKLYRLFGRGGGVQSVFCVCVPPKRALGATRVNPLREVESA